MILKMPLSESSSVRSKILQRRASRMFVPRLDVLPDKNSTFNAARNPILAIIALIAIGGSMCFVAGGLFLFSAISMHQSEKYCSGVLILFVGFVLLATCYLTWLLTSPRFSSWNANDSAESDCVSDVSREEELPPSYDEAIKYNGSSTENSDL